MCEIRTKTKLILIKGLIFLKLKLEVLYKNKEPPSTSAQHLVN
jgi:hypothetical protein